MEKIDIFLYGERTVDNVAIASGLSFYIENDTTSSS